MATFLETYTRLMRKINRPLSELDVLAEAKSAINDAIISLQRNHAYAHTEGLATFDYPANALYVDVGTICLGSLRDVISLQQLSDSGTYEGKPVKIKSYSQIQTARRNYYNKHSVDPSQTYTDPVMGLTIEDGYRNDQIAWVMGKCIGIYPRPAQARTYILHHHVWVPKLVEDGDTNMFLTYAEDVVMMKALKLMHLTMKIDSRYNFTQAEVNEGLASLLAWDSQVKENPNTSIE